MRQKVRKVLQGVLPPRWPIGLALVVAARPVPEDPYQDQQQTGQDQGQADPEAPRQGLAHQPAASSADTGRTSANRRV
jgi:hypothetical protein